MGRFVYIQINMFAALMLLILYINSKSKFPYSRNSKRFRKIITLMILTLVTDTAIRVLDGHEAAWVSTAMWVCVWLYYAAVDMLAYGWFLFTYANLYEDRDLIEHKWLILFTSAPILVLVLMMTGWPGLVFGVDGQNHYVRGTAFLLQCFVWAAYILAAGGMAFFLRRKANMREKREEYVYLAYFPVLPLAGGLLQLTMRGMAAIWPFTVASMVMVYVKMQRTQTSLDPMTGLNNRSRFNQFIQSKIDGGRNQNPWYLLLIDVDKFKQINDSFGHMAGDAALIKVASVLKRTFGKMNAFIARYGGDEFVVVLECRREKDILNAMQQLDTMLEHENRHENTPYQLCCSAGYVRFDGEIMKTKEQLIAAADKEMYLQKKSRNA